MLSLLLNAGAASASGLDAAVVTSFVREGIMGSVAVLFIGLYLKERAAHDATRAACSADLKVAGEKYNTETRRLHEERITVANVLTTEYTE